MPGSLLMTSSPTLRRVTRNESTRSDSSAASNTSQGSVTGNKKVSFNKAVRVKKYPRPKKNDSSRFGSENDLNGNLNGGGEVPGSPGKRFWFKVYKNKHRQAPDPNELRRKNEVIYYGNNVDDDPFDYHDDIISYHPNPSVLNYPVLTSECGTQTIGRKADSSSHTTLLGNECTPLHPSQMPSDPPSVQRNYVKKIVNRFNEEAVLQRQVSSEAEPASPPVSPPGSPRQHSTPKQIPIPPPPPPPIPPPAYDPTRASAPEGLFSASRFKKHPIVNGVKVMFGMGQLKKENKNNHTVYKQHQKSDNAIPNGDINYKDMDGPFKHKELDGPFKHKELDGPFKHKESDGPFKYKESDGSFKYKESDGPFKYKDSDGPFKYKDSDGPFKHKDSDGPFKYKDSDGPFKYKDSDGPCKHKDSDGPFKYKELDGPFKTEIVISEGSETDVKTPYSSNGRFLYGEQDQRNELVKRNGKLNVSHVNEHQDDDGYDYHFDESDDHGRKGKYHVESWDSGNQLLFDTTDVNTATGRTDKGEFVSTVGEKHQLWRNNKRIIVYEEPSPTIIRRKAKSQSDLTKPESKLTPEEKLDKGVSTDELFTRKPEKKQTLPKKQKDSWLRHFRSSTKDKGIQCNKIPTDEPEELYGFGRYKIIRPRNGVVTAYSSVPTLEKTKHNEHTVSSQVNGYNSKDSVIYSQIDKTKKKKSSDKEKKKNLFSDEGRIGSLFKSRSEPLYIGPPPKSQQHVADEDLEDSYYEDRGERTIKTSKKSFGFRLNTGRGEARDTGKHDYREEDWYNVDGDVEAVERQKRRGRNHHDIAEVRQELAEEEISDTSSLSNGGLNRTSGGAGSVMREVDYKKREISYENVPRSDGENNGQMNPVNGLWYRDADEDYRREMAQSEVSYPAGNSVGSDRFYTVDRREKSHRKLPPPSPRAYTLDRRHLKNRDKQKQVPNTSGVKILVNGKEIKDKSSGKKSKKREDPSSVQSDPLYVRGGLAAAYQARQRAAVKRSNSTASGLGSKGRGNHSPNIRRIVAGSSEMSTVSSESDSGRHRRPLVMYIPGVSHPEKASENDDRVSSSIVRSQSMMAPSRPPRMVKRTNQKAHKGSKTDIYRNGDIYEEDEITPLASDINRKKPPKVPADSRKQNDIKRRHSMPKDTKFSWLKWRIRGKPSREP